MLAMLLLDVLVLTSWQVLDPIRWEVLQQRSKVTVTRRLFFIA